MNTYNAFIEPASLSHKIYTADEVRHHEPKAAKLAGLSMYELMERAGHAAFRQLRAEYPQCHNILVLSGHGNNGGDGFVLARLAKEAGMRVDLVSVGDESKHSDDTREALKRWRAGDGECQSWPISLSGFDVIIDALLGTGIKGEVKSPYRDIIGLLNQQNTPVLSIDLPSGLEADTGWPLGCAVNATSTITFVGIKAGLVTGAGKQHCGKLGFSALGIAAAFDSLASNIGVLAAAKHLSPLPNRLINSHKGDYGRLLCIGGNKGMHGAIRLTAEAALRSGAGLVKVLCHSDSRILVAEGMPELMLGDDQQSPESLFDWASCFVIGPGLGQDPWGQSLFDALMQYQLQSDKPMLIDADGLNLLAASKQQRLTENCILTPHPREAARLLQSSSSEIQADRYQAIGQLADKYHCTAILKGAGSLVSANEHLFVLEEGNPGMASGGMGDLLSGMVSGLMAQGIDAANSAVAGASMHALAADLCAETQGQRGMIASDLLPFIRELVNR